MPVKKQAEAAIVTLNGSLLSGKPIMVTELNSNEGLLQ
jgi:hypothetical protein